MSFATFKTAAAPVVGTVSGHYRAARVAVRNITTFRRVAALAEQHGATVTPNMGRFPQLMTLDFGAMADPDAAALLVRLRLDTATSDGGRGGPMNDRESLVCALCAQPYAVEDSDARRFASFCSRSCEREDAADDPSSRPHVGDYDGTEDYEDRTRRDEGRYAGGYRVYRDGSYREDFGGDR